MSIDNVIDELLNNEENVHALAIIGKDGSLITQTENWDISPDLAAINALIRDNPELGGKSASTSITVNGIRYMIVENELERKISTNITGKGHLIIAPVPIGGTGALVCYCNPAAGPRDALFNVQDAAKNLTSLL
jgi:predicted regulator of Ras-like GTPase activity (Roadblock/LC7/MglB family)